MGLDPNATLELYVGSAREATMTFIATDKIYQRMAAEKSAGERARIFRDELLHPLEPLLEASRAWMPHANTLDALAAGMGWLMPDDLATLPDGFSHLLDADSWESAKRMLQSAIDRFIPFSNEVEVEADLIGTILLTRPTPATELGEGYAGGQAAGAVVVSYDRPTRANAAKAGGAIVHEYNHRIRLAVYPWDDPNGIDVAEYAVMEGLAEAFAVALAGDDALGFYVASVPDAALEKAASIIAKNRNACGFGRIRAHIFGDRIARTMGFDEGLGMPDFGGYAVGYHVVRHYLAKTGKSVEEATLVPAHKIIEESGYLSA